MKLLTFRPATLDDAALAADIMTAAYPAMPQDPVVTRYRWGRSRDGYSRGRFIAEVDGRPVALLGWVHGPWEKLPDRHCEIEVSLDRAVLTLELLTELWRWIANLAAAEGAGLLLAGAAEDEQEVLHILRELGYQRDRLGKVWELDLAVHGQLLVQEAKAARESMAGECIEFVTLAGWDDPHKLEKLYELDSLTRGDIPHSLPILHETLEDFTRRTHGPDRPPDRYWIAVRDEQPVALSYLRFPPVRGAVWTGYTCTHPMYRGRGLAKGVKLQSLAQAVELGIPLVLTENDSENAPMLHINEALGYGRRPGFVEYVKRVDRKGDA